MRIGTEARPRPVALTLQKRFQLGSDSGLTDDAEPATNNLVRRIDKHVLRLCSDAQAASDVILRRVINVENHKLDAAGECIV